MTRKKILENAVALRTMEAHAAITAKALSSQTESKVTRANYEHERNQSHWSNILFKKFYTSHLKKEVKRLKNKKMEKNATLTRLRSIKGLLNLIYQP